MNMHRDRACGRAYTSRLKKGNEKVFWGGKVFTQRCVIKKEQQPSKPLNGCSYKCLGREGMFFSCQLAFDTGQKGGDLVPPGAVMGRLQSQNCSPLPAKALDKLCEMMLATAVV